LSFGRRTPAAASHVSTRSVRPQQTARAGTETDVALKCFVNRTLAYQ
jgi:hypothetical protein